MYNMMCISGSGRIICPVLLRSNSSLVAGLYVQASGFCTDCESVSALVARCTLLFCALSVCALNVGLSAPQLRMKKLEEIRLEVDSRRRTVADLSAKVEKQRARLPQTRAKGEDEMQNTIKTMQHKENKLAGAALSVYTS